MSFLDSLLIAAGREKADVIRAPATPRPRRITLQLHDYGEAVVTLLIGDVDGSGETPGVQMEIKHDFIEGGRPAVIALSAREAEALADRLLKGASLIPPSERLRPIRKRLKEGRKE